MSRMTFAGKFFVGFVFSADFAIMTVFFIGSIPFHIERINCEPPP